MPSLKLIVVLVQSQRNWTKLSVLAGFLSVAFFMQLLFMLLSFTLLSYTIVLSMHDFEFSQAYSYSTVKLRRGQKELTFNIEDVMVSIVNINKSYVHLLYDEWVTSQVLVCVCVWGGGGGTWD